LSTTGGVIHQSSFVPIPFVGVGIIVTVIKPSGASGGDTVVTNETFATSLFGVRIFFIFRAFDTTVGPAIGIDRADGLSRISRVVATTRRGCDGVVFVMSAITVPVDIDTQHTADTQQTHSRHTADTQLRKGGGEC